MSGTDRSLATALKNINGISSLLSLVPILTGKTQNVKMVASRILPVTLIFGGVGAGRCLAKLQLGVMLCNLELYRNIVADFTYAHDEYVNRYSPVFSHVASATPERHSGSQYVNHNPSEDYLVEASFQGKGQFPNVVELSQTNTQRALGGFLIFLPIYALEVVISLFCAAEGTNVALAVALGLAMILWIAGIAILHFTRGMGLRSLQLNGRGDAWRHLQVVTLGHNVKSTPLSFNTEYATTFNLFEAKYDRKAIRIAGICILLSGAIDGLSTILVLGLNIWSYPWLALQIAILIVKVGISLEPLRRIRIAKVSTVVEVTTDPNRGTWLPIQVCNFGTLNGSTFSCEGCFTKRTVITEELLGGTTRTWESKTAGISVGQVYHLHPEREPPVLRYLSPSADGASLVLTDTKPKIQSNAALEREFLACLGDIVGANKVPSQDFINAVRSLMKGMEGTMDEKWFKVGAKDLMERLKRAQKVVSWNERA
ncbi:hypothetical protein BT69DRAFT_1333484 [Atractiella rhizophila]|nr:hypothetical protein BT69DRAFT_1333484 [Atractiella rhizophila]